MTKPIRIRLTNVFFVVTVDLGQLPNDSSMLSCSVPAWGSWLKYLAVTRQKPVNLLIVSWRGMQDGNNLRKRCFQKMRAAATSSGWTAERFVYRETAKEVDDIWRCQATSRMEKLL